MRVSNLSIRRSLVVFLVAVVLVLGLRPLVFQTKAAQLPNRSVTLTNDTPGATSSYVFAFDLASSSDIGSIQFQFCANTPIIGTTCDVPVGFDASAAALAAQSGELGFTIKPGTDPNILVLTRTAAAPTPGPVQYEFDNIVNPTIAGSYYVRVQTFQTEDASGADTDYGGLAFAITANVQVKTVVPPYLLFCSGVTISGTDCSTASGNYINFGELSSNAAKTGSTQMVVATNAKDGYTVQMNGTTMLSGTKTIPGLSADDVSRPGTSQFGVNLRRNIDPSVGANPSGAGSGSATADYNIPNRYRFVAGEHIASAPAPDLYRKYTVTYLVNVAKDQPPGIYTSTITYICLASF